MSLIDTVDISEPFTLDPNRDDAVGLALSALLPLAVVVVALGVASAIGVAPAAIHYPVLPLALPAPLANLGAIALFPLWGVARWTAWRAGTRGRAASWWVVALMAVTAAYPYLAASMDEFLLGWLDLFVLLLVAATTVRLASASRAALFWMLPSVLFLGLAAISSYVVVTGGWSPGFAVTVARAHPER